jgi:hypothetical protein
MHVVATVFDTMSSIVATAIKSLPAGHALKQYENLPGLLPFDLPEAERAELDAAIKNLSREHLVSIQAPSWAPAPATTNAEFTVVQVGQRRANGRPPTPANSNDAVVALLKKHRPNDFKGRFTLGRADDTRKWLERRSIHKNLDAVTKLVNRAKRAKQK